MKKQIGVAVAIVATLAGGGFALAQDGSPPEDVPPVDAPPADPPADTPLGPPEDQPAVEVEDTTTTVPVPALPEAPEVPEVDEGPPADTHGAAVSQAAHECPTGPGGIHGQCVSAVARDDDGDGVPDHGPGSDDGADDDEPAPPRGNGNGNGNGRGNGRGPGG